MHDASRIPGRCRTLADDQDQPDSGRSLATLNATRPRGQTLTSAPVTMLPATQSADARASGSGMPGDMARRTRGRVLPASPVALYRAA